LLVAGANLQLKDARGRTPLHHAVMTYQVDAAQLLLNRGADHTAKENRGQTAFDLLTDSTSKEVAGFTLHPRESIPPELIDLLAGWTAATRATATCPSIRDGCKQP